MIAAADVCMWWARRYTRRLPSETANERIAEIESDVWEHNNDAVASNTRHIAHNVDVMRRVLSGVPADLSWRREILRSRERPASEGASVMSRVSNATSASAVVLAALCALPALSIVPLLGSAVTGGASAGEILWVITAMVLGSMLVWGLVLRLRDEEPRKATTLLVVGAPAPSIAWFWLPPMYALTVLLIVFALASHSGTKRALAPA